MGKIQALLTDHSPSDHPLVIAYHLYQRSMNYQVVIIEPSEETEPVIFEDTWSESDEELPF